MDVPCGVDVVDVGAFEHVVALRGDSFLKRVFTERELVVTGRRAERLAARFAAKEAVSKALGTGLGDPREIEVRSSRSGRPSIHVTGAAAASARRQGIVGWALSMSHMRSTAVAFVVALRAPSPKKPRHIKAAVSRGK